LSLPALCSVSTEQQSRQSNRAAEQAAAEQPAGHMTCALLSRDSQLSADCTACTFGTAVCLGVLTITLLFRDINSLYKQLLGVINLLFRELPNSLELYTIVSYELIVGVVYKVLRGGDLEASSRVDLEASNSVNLRI
jgi:hypothetical protein